MVKRINEDINNQESLYLCKSNLSDLKRIMEDLELYVEGGTLSAAQRLFSKGSTVPEAARNIASSNLHDIRKAIDAIDYQLEYISEGISSLTRILLDTD